MKRENFTAPAILNELKTKANPEQVAGMARFGINTQHTLGISVVELRQIAKRLGRDHALALDLWASGIHEARLLAAFVDEPARVTAAQMEAWIADFDSWDVCDQVCGSLFDQTEFAWRKAIEWTKREREFSRRAGFVLMAALAVHNKHAADAAFLEFLPLIKQRADDERNFVRKAVNWALRQIGKRNAALNRAAIKTAREIQRREIQRRETLNKTSASALWIAADALRELTSAPVQARLKNK